MKITRRMFGLGAIAGAVAVPAAATLPAAAPEAAAVLPTTLETLSAYLAGVPVGRTYDPVWGYSHNEEDFYQVESKEEGIDNLDGSPGVVALNMPQDFDLRLEASDVFDLLYNRNEEHIGDNGDFLECTEEQLDQLTELLTRTMWAWVLEHKIDTKAYYYRHTLETHKQPASEEYLLFKSEKDKMYNDYMADLREQIAHVQPNSLLLANKETHSAQLPDNLQETTHSAVASPRQEGVQVPCVSQELSPRRETESGTALSVDEHQSGTSAVGEGGLENNSGVRQHGVERPDQK